MAYSIFKYYLDNEKSNIKNYVDTITEKKLNSKICNMILDYYVDIRYFDSYKHVKDNTIDDICYYVKRNFDENYNDKNYKKNLSYVSDALIILRYVYLIDKYSHKKELGDLFSEYENEMHKKYKDREVLVTDLIKSIKGDLKKKEKYLRDLLSNDFSVTANTTDKKNIFDLVLENTVKIPDLYSQLAINRVYNEGIISEDKMIVYYLLATREILKDMHEFNYNKYYLVDFTASLLNKKNKLANILKMFENDYIKERIILKIEQVDYLENKEIVDELIHNGMSFAIIIDESFNEERILLDIFTYILVIKGTKVLTNLKKYSNIVYI